MRNNVKKLVKKAAALTLGLGLVFGAMPVTEVQAAGDGTATLRIISTTDLHGQSVNQNYDSASEHPKGSLAQVYTLIKEVRSSLKYGATLTVDVGDTVYGYGSDSIMNGAITGSEYMYAEMAKMGYDAITIGNHDFDYGYEYIKAALQETGMNSKVVVSNVYSAKTKNPIWKQNRVITKTVNTTKGVKKQVRIGVFGVTDPTLTSHFDHTGLLVTQDIVESAKEQIESLKRQNVDVIVAIAHSGIGSDEYEMGVQDAVYEMSKLDGIDAIMIGDDHVNFPSGDAAVAKYYDYPDVTDDGKMNGKLVVGVADHGAGIGVADLKLQFKDGKVSVVSGKARLKMVTSKTEPDAKIVKLNQSFQKQINKIYNTSLGKVSSSINNYFAMLEDNTAIQAANESKIQYGLEYTRQFAPEYANLPVVACTDYQITEQSTANNYIDINDDFTVSDALNVQDWNRDCTSAYWITGKQLREWIEWQTASAYQMPAQATNRVWSDDVVEQYVTEEGLVPVTDDQWMDCWANYHVFDGVEYEIDITQPARYSQAGTLINSESHRVTSLTRNGVNVTDDQKFVIVSAQITSSMSVIADVTSQKIIRGNMQRGYNNILLQNYVKQQCEQGEMNVKADDNWKILAPEATSYLIKTSAKADAIAQSKEWYIRALATKDGYSYYQAALGQEQKDTAGPLLVLGLGNAKRTNHNVKIAVETSDTSKVTELKYFPGMISESSASWSGASSILGKNEFEATGNGTYSVRAKDSLGNMTVKYITVSNMDSSILEAPDVDKYTNRKRQITGKADPNVLVYIEADGEIYQTLTGSDGTFSYDLPMQKADSIVNVWVKNVNGASSSKVEVLVGRTGANLPAVNRITNKLRAITGQINDSIYCKVVAFTDKNVYVAKNGGMQNYLDSTIYNDKYSIVETDFSIKNGTFSLTIPVFNAGTPVKVYSIDWIGRASVVTEFQTEEVAPNMPKLEAIYAVDDYVFGKIPDVAEREYTILVNDGEEDYEAVANENGSFKVKVGKLKEGQKLTVTASDVVDGKERTSAKASVTVSSCESVLMPYTAISFEDIDSKGTLISGNSSDYTGTVNLLIGTTRVIVQTDESGNFSYMLSKPRAAGTPIVALIRAEDGSVWDAAATKVELAIPEIPELISEDINTTTNEVKVFCEDQATAVVKIGSTYYKEKKGVYDEKRGGYVYTVKLKKAPKAGKPVVIFMMNESGKSEKIQTIVTEP